jgi:enoyl-CoA hydratase
MAYRYLKTRQEGHVLWVEVHNPYVNFLTVDILQELWQLVREVRGDDSVRVLVLTGGIEDTYMMHFSIPELLRVTEENKTSPIARAGRNPLGRILLECFNTANNLLMDRFPRFEELNLKQAAALKDRFFTLFLSLQMHRLYRAIERLNKVTIAAINGSCNGGASELSACFDFRFMVGDQGFTIGQTEVQLGIIPGGGGSQRWPRLIGKARALEWMLKGDFLEPQKAKQIGILTDVFPRAEFARQVQEFAELMAKRPPVAVHALKLAILNGTDTFMARALTLELLQSLRVFDTADVEKAMRNYAALLKERLDVPADERISPAEYRDMAENALFVDGFEGR